MSSHVGIHIGKDLNNPAVYVSHYENHGTWNPSRISNVFQIYVSVLMKNLKLWSSSLIGLYDDFSSGIEIVFVSSLL